MYGQGIDETFSAKVEMRGAPWMQTRERAGWLSPPFDVDF
jgi:hypothetical protein